MPAPADLWYDLRAAVAAALGDALTAAGVAGVAVVSQDTLDGTLVSRPAVTVTPNGSEQERGGTNVRDDYGYPFLLTLHTHRGDPDVDSATNEPPGLRPTLFREIVRRHFGHRRVVTAPTGVSLFPTEYDPTPPVYDDGAPYETDPLRTAVGVTVVARVPRGL